MIADVARASCRVEPQNSIDGFWRYAKGLAIPPRPKENRSDILDIRKGGEPLQLADETCSGLSKPEGQRSLPLLLLWTELGLNQFEAITYSPDYYLTNPEIAILETCGKDLAPSIPDNSILLELGSDNLREINISLEALDVQGKRIDYYTLNLDRSEFQRTLSQIGPSGFKNVSYHGLLGTCDDGKAWLYRKGNTERPKCVLSLGSTISSMSRQEATDFWAGWSGTLLRSGGATFVIIGIDVTKDGNKVFRAYNDRKGLNKRFIHNAIQQPNKQLESDVFELSDWMQQGEWDAEAGRQKQYLVSRTDVQVEGWSLQKGEKVYVVSSYKYD